MGKKAAQGKIEIRDLEDRSTVIQSFKLSGVDEKVNECGSSELRSQLCLWPECGFDWLKKSFIRYAVGFVRIRVMNKCVGG
jgi:hypothetical protein